MDKVTLSLIGAGGMANGFHYPSLVAFPDVRIAGLCDLDTHKLEETARKFGISRTFTDYRDMLDQTKPDAVYVLMPPHVIFDVAMDVLSRGHHLFVEKPPAVTTYQTQSLAKAATDKNLITAVGFQRRYHPMVNECWRRVKENGPVHQVVSCFYKHTPPQNVHPYYQGAIDILHCDAIHAVDALRYYAGLADVRSVASEVRKLDSPYEVSFNALVHFENNCVGVLLANWRTGRRVFKFEFHSCGASAFVDIDGEGKVYRENGNAPIFSTTHTQFTGTEAGNIVQGFYAESRAFVDAIRSGRQVHNNLQDAVKTMKLADSIFQAPMNQE